MENRNICYLLMSLYCFGVKISSLSSICHISYSGEQIFFHICDIIFCCIDVGKLFAWISIIQLN